MKKNQVMKVCAMVAAVMFLSLTVMEVTAHARAGGARSSGSRGARSYSRPASPYTQPAPSRQQMAPGPQPFQQQARSGGFLSSMAGGIAGGLLGGMLFRSLGMAGGGVGGMGGGGIGMFEILLLAGIGYLIYRFVKNRRPAVAGPVYAQGTSYQPEYQGSEAGRVIPLSDYRIEPPASDTDAGLAQLRRMDPGFDEGRFNDTAMDIFFKVQGAWMNRDLSTASAVMTDEMKMIFQQDLDQLLRDKRVNRLENIAVRRVEIAEVWQESGYDYITSLIHANLLDYTTDELTGAVVAGSKSEPVKFEEYWTFTRPVGNNPWRLCAIDQK